LETDDDNNEEEKLYNYYEIKSCPNCNGQELIPNRFKQLICQNKDCNLVINLQNPTQFSRFVSHDGVVINNSRESKPPLKRRTISQEERNWMKVLNKIIKDSEKSALEQREEEDWRYPSTVSPYNDEDDDDINNIGRKEKSIIVHKDSDFVLFLKSNDIALTPEIKMLYEMAMFNECFVCDHLKTDENKRKGFYCEGYRELKDHFNQVHKRPNKDVDYVYNVVRSDNDGILEWNNNSILGLLDQMIVYENYRRRRRRISKRAEHGNRRFDYLKDQGRCIVKIMKEWQIPQIIFIKYLGITSKMLERYTTAYYLSLSDEDRPKWMRSFF
jgi:hypothetical protein